jgi:hypothetical protein
MDLNKIATYAQFTCMFLGGKNLGRISVVTFRGKRKIRNTKQNGSGKIENRK